jgi:hypothetical protein
MRRSIALAAVVLLGAACREEGPRTHEERPGPGAQPPPPPARMSTGTMALWAKPGGHVIEWPGTAIPLVELREQSVGITAARLIELQKQKLPPALVATLREGETVALQGGAAFQVRLLTCAPGAVACTPDSYAMIVLARTTVPEAWTLPFPLETATASDGTVIPDAILAADRDAYAALSTPHDFLAGDRIYTVRTGLRSR